MPGSILVIHRGEDAARRTFEQDSCGDWAQALPLVLEKLGYLAFESAPPAALADPRTWQRHAAILVPRLTEEEWSDPAIEMLGKGRAQAFLELPPSRLHDALGIEFHESAETTGVFSPVGDLRDAVAAVSPLDSTRVEPPASRPVDRAADRDWQSLQVPIGEAQAAAWREPGWRVQRWEVAGCETLAEWEETAPGRRRWPAIVRRGSLTASSFSIFAYLGQQLTVQPFAGAEHLVWQRSVALETTLRLLLDEMHAAAGVSRARVLSWPEGADWVLNVRHDFDRPQSRKQVEKVLAVHAEAGTAATWYWRARHVAKRNSPKARLRAQGSDAAAVARRVAAAPRNEVALHTEQLWESAEEERGTLERAIRRPVRGTSAHGDPTCFRWQGAPNVLWAEGNRFLYTEFISHSHLVPHRFAELGADGTVGPADIVCLPHHESLDRSTTPGDAAVDQVVAAADIYAKAGGMMQILNHPDLNLEQLADVLGRIPEAGRLDWTAAEAADWWSRTHVSTELRVEVEEQGRVRVESRRGVRGAVLEILTPAGECRRFALHIDAGGAVVVDPARPDRGGGETDRSPEEQWNQKVAPAFAEAARRYYEKREIEPESAGARGTIATNSSLVPGRVEATLRYLRELGDRDSLAGARILDCGSGFGAFAAYLSMAPGSPLVTATDIRPEFVEIGRQVAADAALDGLAYERADMRELHDFGSNAFDIAVVNNAFIYLPSSHDMRRAVDELARVLVPGGHLVMFHANRWQAREPFTRSPLVHLLPRSLADGVSHLTGWEHNHGRVRLISAPAMRRMLRRAGFGSVRVGTIAGGRVRRPPRALAARYYAVVARRDR